MRIDKLSKKPAAKKKRQGDKVQHLIQEARYNKPCLIKQTGSDLAEITVDGGK